MLSAAPIAYDAARQLGLSSNDVVVGATVDAVEHGAEYAEIHAAPTTPLLNGDASTRLSTSSQSNVYSSLHPISPTNQLLAFIGNACTSLYAFTTSGSTVFTLPLPAVLYTVTLLPAIA